MENDLIVNVQIFFVLYYVCFQLLHITDTGDENQKSLSLFIVHP